MDKMMEERLRRQAGWLRESLLWLIREKIVGPSVQNGSLAALDVGCGPGLTMELFAPILKVKGVDSDLDAVKLCNAKGLDVVHGFAEDLPFEDGTFDVVYCSFLLLWLKDPVAALKEMKRVSCKWVVCFAEPDYGGRLDYPQELSRLADLVSEDLKRDGGDPFAGRRLRAMFAKTGMSADVGVHMGVWGIDKLRQESEEELRWLESRSPREVDELKMIRTARDEAYRTGSLFEYNPIFYAIAMKGQ